MMLNCNDKYYKIRRIEIFPDGMRKNNSKTCRCMNYERTYAVHYCCSNNGKQRRERAARLFGHFTTLPLAAEFSMHICIPL